MKITKYDNLDDNEAYKKKKNETKIKTWKYVLLVRNLSYARKAV